jgi:GGDEF domain-containing protein
MPDRLQRRLAEIGAPADVHELASELAEQAVRDPLTGLYNRRFFDESLAQNIETARRYNRGLCLVLFDLDRFKEVNDTLGHEAGDAVLKTFARLLLETARKADIVCRIGGDEFAAILPETGLSTRPEGERLAQSDGNETKCSGNGWKFAERFFQCLETSADFFPNLGTKSSNVWKLSASAGAAALPCENLFDAADQELLKSKNKKHM